MGAVLERIERLHLLLLLAAAAGAELSGTVGGGSVLLGGAVMGANFWLLRQLGRRLLTPGGGRWRGVVVLALFVAKFSLFLGLLGLLFWRVPLDPLGFGAGATVLLVACVVEAVRQTPAPAAT